VLLFHLNSALKSLIPQVIQRVATNRYAENVTLMPDSTNMKSNLYRLSIELALTIGILYLASWLIFGLHLKWWTPPSVMLLFVAEVVLDILIIGEAKLLLDTAKSALSFRGFDRGRGDLRW